jgi:hypothetical protein
MTSRPDAATRIDTEDRIDAILDRALEATFPASDPVAFPLGGGAPAQDSAVTLQESRHRNRA